MTAAGTKPVYPLAGTAKYATPRWANAMLGLAIANRLSARFGAAR
jgi:hypothetical protein